MVAGTNGLVIIQRIYALISDGSPHFDNFLINTDLKSRFHYNRGGKTQEGK